MKLRMNCLFLGIETLLSFLLLLCAKRTFVVFGVFWWVSDDISLSFVVVWTGNFIYKQCVCGSIGCFQIIIIILILLVSRKRISMQVDDYCQTSAATFGQVLLLFSFY